MKIIVDLDGTITIDDKDLDYSSKKTNDNIIDALNQISTDNIIVYTARQMRTYNGDINELEKHTRPIAEKWLQKNKVNYSKLVLGKLWCEEGGYYVDDRNLSIEEFIFKFNGPYKSSSVDICVSCYNEQDNISSLYNEIIKMDRFFNISKIIMCNNGSNDSTLKKLLDFSRKDKRVIVVENKLNKGYGGGMISCLNEVKSDYILTLHADMQYKPYSFIQTHLDFLTKLDKPVNIIPERLNRPLKSSIQTYLMHLLMRIFSFKKIIDFNGQPKLIKYSDINFEKLTKDYTFDYTLTKHLPNHISLPIIEQVRLKGNSSWDSSIIKRLKIFISYLICSIK